MSCPEDLARLSCAIKYLTAAIEDPPINWPEVALTLVATLIGAVVALLGSFILNRKQQNVEADSLYTTRLQDALLQTMSAIGARTVELQALVAAGTPAGPAIELAARANAVWMVARNRDIEVAKSLKYAIDRIGTNEECSEQLKSTRILSQMIRAWGNGSNPAELAARRLDQLEPR